MMIHGYEGDSEKLTAVYITDHTRNIFNQRFEIRPHGEWKGGPVRRKMVTRVCTACGEYSAVGYFCMWCGANMMKEGEQE